MSMYDDVARYEQAGLAAHYHWWPQKEAIAMLDALGLALREAPDGARLTCRLGLRPDGRATVWLAVAEADDDLNGGGTEINNSRPCPPFCGGE